MIGLIWTWVSKKLMLFSNDLLMGPLAPAVLKKALYPVVAECRLNIHNDTDQSRSLCAYLETCR